MRVSDSKVLGTLLIFGLMVSISQTMPGHAQDSTELTEFVSGDVRFVYPTAFATSITETRVEATPTVDQFDQFVPDANPAYSQFTLDGFQLGDQAVYPPTIKIYHTADFGADDTQDYFGYRVEMNTLNELLQQRPDPNFYTAEVWATRPDVPRLPYLPFPSSGQVLRTNIRYVPFDDGWGVRYITYFNQAVQAILDYDLMFTFQGVTDDGSTYITIYFPIMSGTLPTVWPDDLTIDDLIENYPTYINEIDAMLNAQADANFMPSLTTLDDLILSLSVNGTIDYVPMPEATEEASGG